MKKAAILAFGIMSAAPAQAALSGFYDSAEQIGVIMSSEAISNALRQFPVEQISNTGTRKDGAREWTIRTQDCSLKIYLKPVPPKGPGKTTYELDAPGTCK